jgi:tetratricopeptide (TPR) repeat protein
VHATLSEVYIYMANTGNAHYACAAQQDISCLLRQMGRNQEALDCAVRALRDAELIGLPQFTARALIEVAESLGAQGKFVAALERLREAAAVYRQIGDRQRYAHTLQDAAAAAGASGEVELGGALREWAEHVLTHLLVQDSKASVGSESTDIQEES